MGQEKPWARKTFHALLQQRPKVQYALFKPNYCVGRNKVEISYRDLLTAQVRGTSGVNSCQKQHITMIKHGHQE